MRTLSRIFLALALVPVAALAETAAADSPDAADVFQARLAKHCGRAYEGTIVTNEPPPAQADPFDGKRLVMHVRRCEAGRLEIPFHVGEDRSRTWILTRTTSGLRLKHDHRHEDGSPDAVTLYGGDTEAPGTASRQEFPVDEDSRTMFRAEGLEVSVTNVWAMEIKAGDRFVYELSRPGRVFRVQFDLHHEVAIPPAPWGYSE